MKKWMIFILVVTAFNSHANTVCEGEISQLIITGKNIYLGESHGTVEVPAIVKCLVEKRLALDTNKSFTVALEFRSSALDLQSDIWFGTDGRSSAAMWDLMQYLLKLQSENKLNLYMINDPIKFDDQFSQNNAEKQRGLGLFKVIEKSQVLALSGNMHSRKSSPSFWPEMIPAGFYTQGSMVHISIEAIEDGESWHCSGNNNCGAKFSLGFPTNPTENTKVGSFISGEIVEHDYIYFVKKFTASPPKFSKALDN